MGNLTKSNSAITIIFGLLIILFFYQIPYVQAQDVVEYDLSKLDNESFDELLKHGKELMNQENYEAARLHYFKAAEINPSRTVLDTLNNNGNALSARGYPEEAVLWFDKLLEIDPNHGAAPRNKANALFELEKYDEVISYYDKILEIEPRNISVLNDKGRAMLGLGKNEEAIVWFDKTLEVNPKYVHGLNNKGLALYRLGQYDEAISYYDKALEIDPTYQLAIENKELAKNAPVTDFVFDYFGLVILAAIVGGVYLINHFRKKRRVEKNKGKDIKGKDVKVSFSPIESEKNSGAV